MKVSKKYDELQKRLLELNGDAFERVTAFLDAQKAEMAGGAEMSETLKKWSADISAYCADVESRKADIRAEMKAEYLRVTQECAPIAAAASEPAAASK